MREYYYTCLGAIEKLMREAVGDDVLISKTTIDWVNECAGGNVLVTAVT